MVDQKWGGRIPDPVVAVEEVAMVPVRVVQEDVQDPRVRQDQVLLPSPDLGVHLVQLLGLVDEERQAALVAEARVAAQVQRRRPCDGARKQQRLVSDEDANE